MTGLNYLGLPFLEGFFAGASLIIAIGAQNAYVLRQGLQGSYLLLTALTCSLVDALLITCGVNGLGYFISETPWLLFLAKWGGISFLAYYGWCSFRAAFNASTLTADKKLAHQPSFKTVLTTLLALCFLNPHVYLDTVLLLGTISSQYSQAARPLFGLGAIAASFIWFFSLTYGARFLQPLFKKPKAWMVLDILIGCVMWGIAISLY